MDHRQDKKAGNPGVSINITVPKLRTPKFKKATAKDFKKTNKFIFAAACMLVASGLVFGGISAYRHFNNHQASNPNSVLGADTKNKPEFGAAAPAGKPELATGVKDKTSYDPERKVYSYVDTVADTTVIVSQQAVPASFKADPRALEKAANSVGAKTKITTGSGDIWIAGDKNNTYQIVVLVHNDLLLFLRSNKVIANDSWKQYVESLQ